jgi:hypothetical protein
MAQSGNEKTEQRITRFMSNRARRQFNKFRRRLAEAIDGLEKTLMRKRHKVDAIKMDYYVQKHPDLKL